MHADQKADSNLLANFENFLQRKKVPLIPPLLVNNIFILRF